MPLARPWVVIPKPFAALYDPKASSARHFSFKIPWTDGSMLDEKGEFRKSFKKPAW